SMAPPVRGRVGPPGPGSSAVGGVTSSSQSLIWAVPSESFDASPWLATVPVPLAIWLRLDTLVEALPTPRLMPELAAPAPALAMPLLMGAITLAPSTAAAWPRVLSDRLPVALALPEPTLAPPSELFPAPPPLAMVCGPTSTGGAGLARA